ncbi:hypothetical protein AMK59_618, partial [Oryctes borbonicus]
MLDLFTIFSKGGIVLWCFQSTSQIFTPSVNALITNVILQERTGSSVYDHNGLNLHYKLDNEFDLVFVVAYQKILQLSYVDKFLNDIHLEFRDKYKNDLTNGNYFGNFHFQGSFNSVLQSAEEWGKTQLKIPKQMRTFDESLKSKKTVASMIEKKSNDKPIKDIKKKEVVFAQEPPKIEPPSPKANNMSMDEDTVAANRAKFVQKMKKKGETKKSPKPQSEKAGKKPRVWELSGSPKDLKSLERTVDKPDESQNNFIPNIELVGKMQGSIKDLEVEESSDEEYEEEDEQETKQNQNHTKVAKGGMFSLFKGLVGSKNLTQSDMEPILEKLKDLLIGKNVAADISIK